MSDVARPSDEYRLWNPFTQMQDFLGSQLLIVERGEGPYLFDQRGKQYLNLTSCLWNAPLGLSCTEVVEAIGAQLENLGYSTLFRASHRPAINLANRIAHITPDGLSRVFLTSNGSESVETAIKMVRQFFSRKGSGKYKVISLERAYHGVSYGALAASGSPGDKAGFEPMPEGFIQVPAPYSRDARSPEAAAAIAASAAQELEKTILAEGPETVAMFLIEPVQGFGGVIIPTQAYFDAITETCRKYDVKLVLDEVTTGFGRTGRMFAAENWGLKPDVMCLGKALGAGYFPVGATVASEEIWNAFQGRASGDKLNHGSTNAGHPGACAAALAAIDIYTRDDLISRAKSNGEHFLESLKELAALSIVDDVRGIGMMFAIDLVRDGTTREPLDEAAMTRIITGCFANGLWVHLAGSRILLLPPFIMDAPLLDEAYTKLKKVLTKAQGWV